MFGGSYGRGAMTCRTGEHFTGPWSAPTMMALEGGSFGLQLGGQATLIARMWPKLICLTKDTTRPSVTDGPVALVTR